jgi:transcriptional regulator with XRE-family HTH domain
MKNRLKHFRVAAGMTQTKVAEAVGITQPSYQRWETGSADIPEAKLKKLAKVLKTTPEALHGRHPPIRAAFYDDSAPRHLQYYGEVAVHFRSASEALLLSISEEARSHLFRSLRHETKFVVLKDLGNRTVAIRRSAISDLYLSSEAYDDYGPEHHNEKGYKEGTPLQLPDPRDWEIIECLADDDDYGLKDFAPEDVERVEKMVVITDEEFEKLVADGHIKPEDLETEKAARRADTLEIFGMANSIVYQLSNGPRRDIPIVDSEALFETFRTFVDDISGEGNDFDNDDTILLQAEGYHRAIYINPDAVDYISIPTHWLEKASDEVDAAEIDAFGDDDDKPSKKVAPITGTASRKGGGQ